MAEASDKQQALRQCSLTGLDMPKRRKSYSREYKLAVVEFWRAHEKNVSRTAQHFYIDRKMVQRWVKDEEKIKASRKGAKKVKHDRRAEYPDMEEQLHSEYRELRRRGLKVKGWWFQQRGKQIFEASREDLQVLGQLVHCLQSTIPHQLPEANKRMPEGAF